MNFEIVHWPNPFGKHALSRLLVGYIKGWAMLSVIVGIFFGIYYVTKIDLFWTFTMLFVVAMAAAPLLAVVSFYQRDRKNPAYGINKDGFLLNERGWDAAFFHWDEIASIKEFNDPQFGRELHFEFVSYAKAIKKPGQDKFSNGLFREYEFLKQPKKISTQLVKGDINAFIDLFIQYFEAHRNAVPKPGG